MLPISTILHPTDFSERSDRALHLACALAHDYSADLVIVHVTAPPMVVFGEGIVPPNPREHIEEAQHHLDSLDIPNEYVHVHRVLAEGDPATEILRIAQERQTDLIVMGTHGRTGLRRFLMGSVAEQLVRRATCPVLTVPQPFPPVVEPAMAGVAEAAG